jgi:hypothetical protein
MRLFLSLKATVLHTLPQPTCCCSSGLLLLLLLLLLLDLLLLADVPRHQVVALLQHIDEVVPQGAVLEGVFGHSNDLEEAVVVLVDVLDLALP